MPYPLKKRSTQTQSVSSLASNTNSWVADHFQRSYPPFYANDMAPTSRLGSPTSVNTGWNTTDISLTTHMNTAMEMIRRGSMMLVESCQQAHDFSEFGANVYPGVPPVSPLGNPSASAATSPARYYRPKSPTYPPTVSPRPSTPSPSIESVQVKDPSEFEETYQTDNDNNTGTQKRMATDFVEKKIKAIKRAKGANIVVERVAAVEMARVKPAAVEPAPVVPAPVVPAHVVPAHVVPAPVAPAAVAIAAVAPAAAFGRMHFPCIAKREGEQKRMANVTTGKKIDKQLKKVKPSVVVVVILPKMQ